MLIKPPQGTGYVPGKCFTLGCYAPATKNVFNFDFCDEHAEAYLKDFNQAPKSDAGKLRLTLVPSEIINAIARVREYGVNKYGAQENWKEIQSFRWEDAAYRHWLAYLQDPVSVDKESGLPHLWHLACNIAFLCENYKEQLNG